MLRGLRGQQLTARQLAVRLFGPFVSTADILRVAGMAAYLANNGRIARKLTEQDSSLNALPQRRVWLYYFKES